MGIYIISLLVVGDVHWAGVIIRPGRTVKCSKGAVIAAKLQGAFGCVNTEKIK